VSFIGSAGAFFGSFLIAANAFFYDVSLLFVLLITISGFLGSVVDSILGATVQAQYKCPNCNKITEKISHCRNKTLLESGYKWVNNDVVNTMCTIGGALFTWLLIRFIGV
jgi:uncharacterized membrane protein